MGCFQSKKEPSDTESNVFHVINVNETGGARCSGQLEITDLSIILYRDRRHITTWPLHSLRRYGFDADTFSFEAGRRCDTGEGIYAFKSRKASQIFQKVQQQIHLRSVPGDTNSYPASGLSPMPHGRQTLQANVIHRSSIDNGHPDNFGTFNNTHSSASHSGATRNIIHSLRSSNTDILEVMPLYPHDRLTNSQVTNIYQLRDIKRENNNNTDFDNERHDYTNEFMRDLALLRSTLRRETARITMRDIEDETRFLESRFIINCRVENIPLSPTLSGSSEHYAQLQQDVPRLYVNIASQINMPHSFRTDSVPASPLTQKQDEYCNLSCTNKSSEINSYANLMLSDKVESLNNGLLYSEHKHSEPDTLTSMSLVEDPVNYAVLDIDSTKETIKANGEITSPEKLAYNHSKNENSTGNMSQPRGRLVSQNSTENESVSNSTAAAVAATTTAAIPSVTLGYTTIDFDKTVALTSVAAITDANIDGARKTRHNSSTVLCGSPNSVEKSRII